MCTPPDEDINGWDYLVEFARPHFSGPLENSPAIKAAYVQIKSTTQKVHSVSVKLSNVLNACRSPDPWFVILVARHSDGTTKTFGRHMWRDEIETGLTAVRAASVVGRRLNRERLTYSFDNNSIISGNVAEWMEREIREIGPDYSAQKQFLSDALGYDDGYGEANVTIEGTPEEIALAFLGVNKSIPASSFSYTPQRFGIADEKPLIEDRSGTLQITPTPSGTAELRLRTSLTEPSIVLTADVYSFGSRDDLSHARLRFSAPPVELIWAAESGRTQAYFDLAFDQKFSLTQLENYARICTWSSKAAPKIEVWSDKGFVFGGTARFANRNVVRESDFLLLTFEVLREISKLHPGFNIRLSLDDIQASLKSLSWFSPFMSKGMLQMLIPLPDVNPPNVRSFFYYAFAEVGCWTFGGIVRRVVTEDVICDEGRRITTAGPVVLQTYLMEYAPPDFVSRIISDYEAMLSELETQEELLSFGDMVEFGRKLAEMNAVPPVEA